MAILRLLIFLGFFHIGVRIASSVTDNNDAATLQALKAQWKNVPPSWQNSNDPCGGSWDGVTCNDSRVTGLGLSSMNLEGKLSGDIGGLSELTSLDLSFNSNLTGSLSPRLGDLKKLTILILAGCGFSGSIPDELGNLAELSFLALNSNKFTGTIPSSLGNLLQLYWLDIADNQLSGQIPVSTSNTTGLDRLLNAKHFHFNKNKLTGSIPPKLFSAEMKLIHLLCDGNQLSGSIPSTLGLVQTLEVLRLDRNTLSGSVPSNLSNLTELNELHLAHNNLIGPLPNLSQMSSLNYVDLSNNSFDSSLAPAWFSNLSSLTTLIMEFGTLQGEVPQKVFSLPQIQQVKLRNNAFNGTLDMGSSISSQLQLVDLQFNLISKITLGNGYTKTLILIGNPLCDVDLSNNNYCKLQQGITVSYSTSLSNCGSKTCDFDQKLNPQSCECSYPYEGTLYFRGPSFRELSNVTLFNSLEKSLWQTLGLTPGSVSLENLFFNSDDYLQMHLSLFPTNEQYFNRSEIQRLGFALSNQTYKPPPEFGPYYFIASPYGFLVSTSNKRSISSGVIAGISVGCGLLLIGLVGVAFYALRQKKRAEKAIGLSRPFASWVPSGNDSGGAPQLKGARWFSYEELKKCTNNFSESNEIGAGGYGKVYRGVLPDGVIVAVKRAQQGSTQGAVEFKNEIELLSRVHHKNLVGLVGFCFEQGEQMLVYEFMPNGTLREALSGKSGIQLDWKRRLRMALGSARGLAYLHELANPPIIHRDVKSTNILLDEHLTAKVADFGLSKLIADGDKGHVSTQVKGTLGYLDPEYYMTNQLTEKSDVYSFGVVMLEFITAKQPIEKGKYIVREVRTLMNKNDDQYGVRELIDPAIRNKSHLLGFGRFLELAMQCVEESAAKRPMMNDIVKAIETILQSDSIDTNSTSASSSATDFSKGVMKHPYNEDLSRNDFNDSTAFEYSGKNYLSTSVEPK